MVVIKVFIFVLGTVFGDLMHCCSHIFNTLTPEYSTICAGFKSHSSVMPAYKVVKDLERLCIHF